MALRAEGVVASGRGTATAQRLEQGRADPRQRLGWGAEVSAGKPGQPAKCPLRAGQRRVAGSVPGDPRSMSPDPLKAALTSALPQMQPDGSVQTSESKRSVPGPWKRRRPAEDVRKAARSSSRVNVCG